MRQKQNQRVVRINKSRKQKSKKTDHSDIIVQIVDYTQNLDSEKVHGQIEQLSKAIGVVREMIGDMKKPSANKAPRAPFSLRKD